MALGEHRGDVLRLVVGQAARLEAVGLGLGVLGAVALGRVMASALFGLVRPDAANLAVVTAFQAAVAFATAWIPARRATRIDPLRALRGE
ncbi:MAG TPA: FtsX-like permease family protein [Thermoanaerobaculia bacterium]|jgi:ABC-type antimicrobial peptide transport system permease subunit|nr:FtsX-like permease family protein [Thermoanaerobaculia bacterium]